MTNSSTNDAVRGVGDLLQQTITTFANVLEQSTQLGVDLLNSLTNAAGLPRIDLSSMRMPSLQGCGCKIPPPCWMPQSAGHVVSHVCHGSSATVRISVTNCGPVRRSIEFDDGGKNSITFQPSTLSLGPMETDSVRATVTAAPGDCDDEHSALVWIRGCKDHYLRWTVRTVRRGAACSCHEVSVEDCPDYIHHWYDHFYCPRPCPSKGR